MGITVSPASSSGGGGGSSGTLPVIPGTSVEREIYTDTGFSTGDYVYRYGAGSVGSNNVLTGSVDVNWSYFSQIENTFVSASTYPSSFNRSNFVGPSEASGVTYSGSTVSYNDEAHAPSSVGSIVNLNGQMSTVLSNGNIVVLQNGQAATTPSTSLYYTIIQPDGTQVAADIVATDYDSSSSQPYGPHYDVCAIPDGFTIIYKGSSSSNVVKVVVYDNDGVVTTPLFQLTTGINNYFYPRIRYQKPQDRYHVVTCNTATLNGYLYNSLFNMDFSVAKSATQIAGSYPSYYSFEMECFEDGSAIIANHSNGSYCGYVVINPNGTINTASYTPANASSPPRLAMAGPRTAALISTNTTSVYLSSVYLPETGTPQVYDRNVASDGYNYAPQPVAVSPYSRSYQDTSPTGSGISVIVYYRPGTGTNYVSRILTDTSTNQNGQTWTASARTDTTIPASNMAAYSRMQAMNLFDGTNAVVYKETSAVPNYAGYVVASIDNGYSYPAVYFTPSQGYYVIGIATTTAAAGSVGSIIINGVADLSSSFGTSSTPISFNGNIYNDSSPFSGTRGYVVNRTVTITGLE